MGAGLAAALARVAVFETLNEGELAQLTALAAVETHAGGTVLFRQNDVSNDLYVILRGSVSILVTPGLAAVGDESTQAEIAVLRGGQLIGEVALVDQGLRTATARVREDGTELARFARRQLLALCDAQPPLGYQLMQQLAADLALKLRSSDLLLRQLQQPPS